MESPHKCEYDKNNNPISPAMGTTGINLASNLETLFQNTNLNLSGGYKIFLVNAIQYQTSLGKDTNCYRVRIWLNTWFNCGYEDLLFRIIKIRPQIVINLCTKGNHSKDPLFDDFLCKDVANCSEYICLKYLLEINHNIVINNNDLYIGNKKIYNSTYISKYRKMPFYTLNGFVQTLLDKYKCNYYFKFSHPSSYHFLDKEKKFLDASDMKNWN
jgi:hypothetical protein